MKSTCSNAKRKVDTGRWLLPLQPVGLEAVKAVEVDKVGAAQAADDWEPTSVWRKSAKQGGVQNQAVSSTKIDVQLEEFDNFPQSYANNL